MHEAIQNVESIQLHFEELEDPRSTINRRHLLGDLIVISVMAVIAGADGPTAIGLWAENNEVWLKQRLALPHGIPSHDTFGRLLAALSPAAFQACFSKWIASVCEAESDGDPQQVAVDGKVLRRSHNHRKELGPLWLVSAWSVQCGISLGQLATDEKSNEIKAIPDLLDKLELKDTIVTIDAGGCQRAIARKIINAGGDYVFSLKGNQSRLRDAVANYTTLHMENDFADVPCETHQESVKGHGRVDNVTYYHLPVPEELAPAGKWPGLKTIGIAIRMSESRGKSTTEVRYFISSIAVNAERFARLVRGHWAIENTLHWCLDVTFREDESRVADRNCANNLAWLKRFAVSLLKQQKDKLSIAMRRRAAGWNREYLAQVLGIPGV